MSYRVTRIVGVKDDVEVVKLSCEKKIKITPQEYNKQLKDFYDSWGVKLDYVEIESTPILKGQRGGRKPIVSDVVLLRYVEENPTLTQRQVARKFGISHQAVSYKIQKLKRNG